MGGYPIIFILIKNGEVDFLLSSRGRIVDQPVVILFEVILDDENRHHLLHGTFHAVQLHRDGRETRENSLIFAMTIRVA